MWCDFEENSALRARGAPSFPPSSMRVDSVRSLPEAGSRRLCENGEACAHYRSDGEPYVFLSCFLRFWGVTLSNGSGAGRGGAALLAVVLCLRPSRRVSRAGARPSGGGERIAQLAAPERGAALRHKRDRRRVCAPRPFCTPGARLGGGGVVRETRRAGERGDARAFQTHSR